MQSTFKFYWIICILLFSVNVAAEKENNKNLKLDKDNIKVYVFKKKNSDFAAFKAITYIHASMDSVLAVMLDNTAYTEWIHKCKQSIEIKKINFFERYHYQVIDIPFPFVDRDIVMHSTLKQHLPSQSFSIISTAVSDYCNGMQSTPCEKVRQSKLIRISQSQGTHILQPVENGLKITWIQHTDPAGNLPSWLVNFLLVDIPYRTLKNLARKVNEEQYKKVKIIYDRKGLAVALNIPKPKPKPRTPSTIADDFGPFPTF